MAEGNSANPSEAAAPGGGLPDDVRSVVNNDQRLRVVETMTQSDHISDAKLDAVARLAADLMDCPTAFVSLVDSHCLWFAGTAGISAREVSVDNAIGAHVIASPGDEIFVIEDARADARFADNPKVTGEPFVRFYAALPLVADGQRIGVLSVTAPTPKSPPTQAQKRRLRDLALIASSTLQLKATERANARLDTAMQLEAARHAFALRVAGIASWVWHIDSGIVECGSKMRELFGFPGLGSISIDKLLGAIDAEDRERVTAELRSSQDSDTEFTSEFRTGAGETWLFGHGQVLERNRDGKAKTFAGVFINVTARKQAERRHEEDRVKQALLLRELIHRVKNTLAVIQSITRQTLRTTPDPQRFAEVFQARIASLAASHTLLADHEWADAELEQIIEAQVLPLVPDDKDRITTSGPKVSLSAETSTQIGLVFHELATNALKHGSLSTETGRVSIEWEKRGREVHVRWTETGAPASDTPEKPVLPGFGTTLIQMSVSEYKAKRLAEGMTVSFVIDLRTPEQD